MADSEFLNILSPYLKYVHGTFNAILFLIFLYQGWIGLRIRKKRKTDGMPAVHLIRRHRTLGPFLVVFILFGFFGGIGSIYLSWGSFFLYPIHFLNGTTIGILTVATFTISRKIRAQPSAWRDFHALIGLAIVTLFVLQVNFGLRMLFGV